MQDSFPETYIDSIASSASTVQSPDKKRILNIEFVPFVRNLNYWHYATKEYINCLTDSKFLICKLVGYQLSNCVNYLSVLFIYLFIYITYVRLRCEKL